MLIKFFRLYRKQGLKGLRYRLLHIIRTMAKAPVRLSDGQIVDRNDYQEWIRRYSTIDDLMRASIRARVTDMLQPPLISVIMPTHNSNVQWLCAAIESVQKQLYTNWELCIADDASTNPNIRLLLERLAAQDSRIKVVFRTENGHISAASNSALGLATGNWVALLDHDDVLSEDALFCVAQLLESNPNVRLVYSDEDKIDGNGTRHTPYFKCNWNPDLFYSQNMFSHLGIYHRDLVNSVGGFRFGFEGAQDYDLALRCIEKLEPEQIAHIPRVLYHWRAHPHSTSSDAQVKPYAMIAGQRALNEHYQRAGTSCWVELLEIGYRTRHQLPLPAPLVSLLMTTQDCKAITELAVQSILRKTTYPNYEIIILDNGSVEQETLEWFKRIQQEDTRVKVIHYEQSFNYSNINNSGIILANGSVIGLIKNTVEVIAANWLDEMVSHALRDRIGCVGAKLYYPDDTVMHGGYILHKENIVFDSHKHLLRAMPGYFGRAMLVQNISAVSGSCLVVRKEIVEAVGYLDENNLQTSFYDVDLSLKVREAGYQNLWTPFAELYQHEPVDSIEKRSLEEQLQASRESLYMKNKWRANLFNDPFYNPNLTLDYEDFSLAWPPDSRSLDEVHA
jgi:O-antigen biosynthesis protein